MKKLLEGRWKIKIPVPFIDSQVTAFMPRRNTGLDKEKETSNEYTSVQRTTFRNVLHLHILMCLNYNYGKKPI